MRQIDVEKTNKFISDMFANSFDKSEKKKFVTWSDVCESIENLESFLTSWITCSFIDMGVINEETMKFKDQKCYCGNVVDGHVGICSCGKHVSYKQFKAMKMVKEEIGEALNYMWSSKTKKGSLLLPGTDIKVSVQEAAAIQAKVNGSKFYQVENPLFYSNYFVKEALRLQASYEKEKNEKKTKTSNRAEIVNYE